MLIITGLYSTKTIAKNTLSGAKTSEFYNTLHDADKYHEAMKNMMEKMKAVKLSGNIDYDFALLMIEHHKGTIDLSKTELKEGKDAKIKQMASKIEEDQTKGIKKLNDWLERHKTLKNSPGNNIQSSQKLMDSMTEMMNSMEKMIRKLLNFNHG